MTLSECITKLDEFPGKLGRKGEELCREACVAGGHRVTGRLANSFHETHTESTVEITTELEYAKYVVKGRGAVKPRTKKALSNLYGGAQQGYPLFGPVAYASEYKGDNFVKSAASNLAAQAESIFFS